MIGRIVLPKTTSLSLNDRFSHLRQLREQQQQQQQQQLQQQLQQQGQQRPRPQQSSSSLANQRLVAQMESRPSVVAALTGQRVRKVGATAAVAAAAAAAAAAGPQKRLHVRQRLAIQARLGTLRPAASRGVFSRLGRGRPIVKRLQAARAFGSRPQSWQRGAGRGARGRGRGLGRQTTTFVRGGGGVALVSWRGRGGTRGRGRAGVRGRGRGYGAAPKPSREELDKQLDEYMASTKGHLDAELDAYMREAAI